MSKRMLFVIVAVIAAFLATSLVVVADSEGFWGSRYWRDREDIPIHWKVSGTLAYVQFWTLPPDAVSPPGFPLGILIQAVIKGVPDDGQFTVTSVANPPEPLEQCGGGLGQTFANNDMVVTLADLSMLFAELEEGWACFNLEDGTVNAEAHMIITGGTGKYKDATGDFTGTFLGQPVGTSGILSEETGEIEGHIDR